MKDIVIIIVCVVLQLLALMIFPLKGVVAMKDNHESCCATHNMPAYPNKECDCKESKIKKDKK